MLLGKIQSLAHSFLLTPAVVGQWYFFNNIYYFIIEKE